MNEGAAGETIGAGGRPEEYEAADGGALMRPRETRRRRRRHAGE